VQLGSLPVIACSAALGLAVCTVADALSRSTRSSSQLPFWIGLLLIFVPVAYRACRSQVARGERIALVVLLGFALYLVKVVHDPFGFTYADELVHAHNANEIVRTHTLFGTNSILEVTPRYPGLESVTAALSSMSGLSSFGAGLIVVGAGRLVIMLGLFLLFERVSGSARVGALATVVYTANANFLFFSSQFSYESLSLPLLVLVLFVLAEQRAAPSPALRRLWTLPALLGVGAVVVTHHLTSYALAFVLLALSAATFVAAPRRLRWRFPLWLGLVAIALTATWLLVVASATVGYLSPVITDALTSTFHTLSGEASPRRLFASGAGAYHAPLLERAVGIGSIVLLAAALPVGLLTVWRRYRLDPFARVFSVAAVAFFGLVLLRFVPGAWETANRSSEFLFLGLSFVVALAVVGPLSSRRAPALGAAVAAGLLAVVFAGGVIAAWLPRLRLSQPYEVDASSHAIVPEGRALAGWAAGHIGSGRGFAATSSDARLLLAYAGEFAVAGKDPDVADIISTATLPAWQLELLRKHRLRYVVVDLRTRSRNNMTGYYFGRRPPAGHPDRLLSVRIPQKFDRLGADRIWNSGAIAVYDLGKDFGGRPKP
jgi:hypothetical protein